LRRIVPFLSSLRDRIFGKDIADPLQSALSRNLRLMTFECAEPQTGEAFASAQSDL